MKKETTNAETPHLRFAVLAADVVLCTVAQGELLVRLIPVERPPHITHGQGLPGGLIDPRETAEEAAHRLINTKALVDTTHVHLEQLYTFSSLERDPRGRVVAVAYLALVPWEKLSTKEREHTAEAWWSPARSAHRLAYDHDEMLALALERLRSRATYTTLIRTLMPREFTLTELEHAYELLVHTDLDKRNFRKKILKLGILTATPHKRTEGAFRPAQLYRFTNHKVQDIEIL